MCLSVLYFVVKIQHCYRYMCMSFHISCVINEAATLEVKLLNVLNVLVFVSLTLEYVQREHPICVNEHL